MLWFAGWLVAGRPLYLAAYGLLLGLVAARFLPNRDLGLQAERGELPARATVGDVLEPIAMLRAGRRLPPLVLEDAHGPGVGGTATLAIPSLAGGEDLELRHEVVASRRGAHRIGPLHVVTTDRLGLTQRRVEVLPASEVLVHPLRWHGFEDPPRARRFDEPPRRPVTTRPWPSGYELAGLRDYRPGDDLRRIVWRASARTGRVVVREAERGITDMVTVVVDSAEAVHHTDVDGISTTFETAVRVAATLVEATLVDGLAASLTDVAGQTVGPLRGRQEVVTALDACARLDLTAGTLAGRLAELRALGGRALHLIVVTTTLDHAARTSLRLLLDRDTSVTVVDVSETGAALQPPAGVALLRARSSGPQAVDAEDASRAAARSRLAGRA